MFFEHDGVRIHYEVKGEGAPLLLLHGWGGKIESFLPVIRDFSDKKQVIALDFPGHGESAEPGRVWGVPDFTEAVYQLIRHLGIEKLDVVAHSFGGRVAIYLASHHPECVNRMALTGCAGIPNKGTGRAIKKKLFGALKGLADSEFAQKTGLREAAVKLMGSADYRALSPEMRKTFSAVIEQDLTEYLPEIQCPVILVWGVNDTETPIWMGEIMEQKIPDAALIRFNGAGHFAYLDLYPQFRAILESFFK